MPTLGKILLVAFLVVLLRIQKKIENLNYKKDQKYL